MKNLKTLLLTGALSLSLVLTACGNNANEAPNNADNNHQVEADNHNHNDNNHNHNHDHDHDHDHEDQEKREDVKLSDWDGDWNSVYAYKDDAEVLKGVESEAKEDGKEPKAFLEEKMENREFDFGGMVVDGDKVIFHKGKANEEGETKEVAYKFTEAAPMEHGGATMYWYVFETESKDVPKYMALMDVHGEDTMAHFHVRLGDDKAKLVDSEDEWYPTFVRASTPASAMAEFLSH